MMRFINWLKNKIADKPIEPERPVWQTGAHAALRPKQNRPPLTGNAGFSSDVGGRVVDGGPGKNILIKNKYVREDSGTHETLKIVDDSLLESDEEFGADPYNTGRFDRSRSWDSSRSRK